MLLILLLFALMRDAKSEKCQIGTEEMNCCTKMTNAGIDLKTFGNSVTHGVHSLTIETINYYFGVSLPLENDIPTVNTNLTGKKILHYAPKLSNDDRVLSLSFKTMDFILSNSDNPNEFMFRGQTIIENLSHAAHMDDVWLKTKTLYEALKNNTNFDESLCQCITREKETGIMREMLYAAYYIRHFDSLRFIGPGIHHGLDSKKFRKIPRLTNSESWKFWKSSMIHSVPQEKDLFNFASYMLCKLRKYGN